MQSYSSSFTPWSVISSPNSENMFPNHQNMFSTPSYKSVDQVITKTNPKTYERANKPVKESQTKSKADSLESFYLALKNCNSVAELLGVFGFTNFEISSELANFNKYMFNTPMAKELVYDLKFTFNASQKQFICFKNSTKTYKATIAALYKNRKFSVHKKDILLNCVVFDMINRFIKDNGINFSFSAQKLIKEHNL